MKKHQFKLIIFTLVFAILAGCASQAPSGNEQFDSSKNIVPINRESGSGTKISFLDILNIEESDLHSENENIVSETGVVQSAVENDKHAVGYLSYSEISSQVKAVSIDGVMPTKENIISGTYPLVRTFYLVTKNDVSNLVQDFLSFISANTDFIEKSGYIPIEKEQGYASTKPSGEIKISGSSSVYPLMEKLIEQYKNVNPNAEIEINKTDSSNGIKNVQDEIAHISMSSRKLTEEELRSTKEVEIAKDAIAVIVNSDNPTLNISLEQLKNIYLKKIQTWKDIA